MMARTGGDALATEVSRLFYDRELSKIEIGERLGISRFRVARLLTQARRHGLVRIEYRDAPEGDRALAETLEERHGLDVCVVAATSDEISDGAARLAAGLIGDLLERGETVGVAWGSTLAAVIDRLPVRRVEGLTVVPLAGGSTSLEPGRSQGELARRFAERLGGRHRDLYAPAFVATPSLRDALLGEAEIAAVVDAYASVTTAIVGIGAWGARGEVAGSSLLASGALGADERSDLRRRGAVGELVVHPFDAAGRFVAPDLAERAVAISVDRLRAVRRVIAVAAGAPKAHAIRAALSTGVIDMLVTDAAAAGAVIAAGSGA